MIPWLERDAPFPPVRSALKDPNGLLAAGADLSTERLLEAYRHGIFPWFSEGEPILWWSPDPRMILFRAHSGRPFAIVPMQRASIRPSTRSLPAAPRPARASPAPGSAAR